MVTITDITAMEIWAQDGLIDQLGNPYAASGLSWAAESAREVWDCGLDRLGVDGSKKAPVHVLVDSTKSRIQSDRIVSHVWSGRIPAGSLYLLAPGVLIASPAFCCLQIASRASFPRTASVVMECLGLYGKAPVKRGFLDRRALLTPEELTSYLDEAGGLMGAKKVRSALRHALYPTRSPLETKTVLLLTLPVVSSSPVSTVRWTYSLDAQKSQLVRSPCSVTSPFMKPWRPVSFRSTGSRAPA